MKGNAMKHQEMPKSFGDIDELFTSNPAAFREALTNAHATENRLKKESQEFSAATPTLGKAIFRIRLYTQVNLTDPMFAGRTPSECVRAFLGVSGDDKNALNHAQSCANAFRLAYVGMTGPEKQTEEEATKASTFTREKYFSEKDYDGQSGNTLGKLSRILTRVNDDLKHPAVIEACAVIRGSAEKKAPVLQAILDRLEKAEDGKVTFLSEDEAKAKAAKTEEKAGFNLADAGECMAMAGTLAKANLPAMLAQVVVEAQTAETPEVKDSLLRTAAAIVAHLSAKDGVDETRAKFGALVKNALADISTKAEAVKAGADAGLPGGVELRK